MDREQQILNDDALSVISRTDISFINKKSILIAGASGLIGTHMVYSVTRFVSTHACDVRLYIVTRRGLPVWLEYCAQLPYVTVLRGDLTDIDFLRSLPQADMIIDAAGYAAPGQFMNEAVNTLKINTSAVFELMNKLKRPGKFLFMSSSAVYTGLTETPFEEDRTGNADISHPRACYIEGKKCGEAICNAFRTEGVDAKSVRLSITYGPGAGRDMRVINSFIRSALTEGEIRLMDSGSALKAFMYVSDAVELIWKIMLEGKSSVYNIGGSEQVTIAQLARIIGEQCNVPVISGSDGNSVKGAITAELLSMKRVESEFGRRELLPLTEGIRRTVEWSKINLYKN